MASRIIWITLFLQLCSEVIAFCPSKCICSDERHPTVDCTGAGLTGIPILLNPRTRSLNLRNNRISSVSLDELSIYTHLEFLDLSYNRILELDRGAFFRLQQLQLLRLNGNLLNSLQIETFAGLQELRVLDLSENRLHRLATSIFADLRRLEVLNLSGNSIGAVSPGALTGLGELNELLLNQNNLKAVPLVALHAPVSLKLLDLSYNQLKRLPNESFAFLHDLEVLKVAGNELEWAEYNAFVGLQTLRRLDLRANKLYRMPTLSFRVLTELLTLQIGGNLFETLPTSSFEGLSRLKQLQIDDCPYLESVQLNAFSGLNSLITLMLMRNPKLSTINSMAFEQPNQLRQLFLADNGLTTLSTRLLIWRQLDVLDLRNNPWHCDCDLAWLAGILRKIQFASSRMLRPICHSPPNFAGKELRTLGHDEGLCGEQTVNSQLIFTIVAVVACLSAVTMCLVLLFCFRYQLANYCGLTGFGRQSMYSESSDCSGKKSLLQSTRYCTPSPPNRRLYATADGTEYCYTSTVSHPRTISTLSRTGSFRIIANYPVPITEL